MFNNLMDCWLSCAGLNATLGAPREGGSSYVDTAHLSAADEPPPSPCCVRPFDYPGLDLLLQILLRIDAKLSNIFRPPSYIALVLFHEDLDAVMWRWCAMALIVLSSYRIAEGSKFKWVTTSGAVVVFPYAKGVQ